MLNFLILISNYSVFSQQSDIQNQADSLHGLILKPEITGLERPADMFQRNCADCHTEAIMYYTRYSQLWDTTFKSREKFIHTWIRPVWNDNSTDIQLFAKGINVFNDTTPVKNAMIAVSVRKNSEWIPVNSQILLTSDSGQATLKINEELNTINRERYEILVQLVDEIVYPNGKYRLRMNWNQDITGNSEINQLSQSGQDKSKVYRPGSQFIIVLFVIVVLIILFYFLYTRFLS